MLLEHARRACGQPRIYALRRICPHSMGTGIILRILRQARTMAGVKGGQWEGVENGRAYSVLFGLTRVTWQMRR